MCTTVMNQRSAGCYLSNRNASSQLCWACTSSTASHVLTHLFLCFQNRAVERSSKRIPTWTNNSTANTMTRNKMHHPLVNEGNPTRLSFGASALECANLCVFSW